MTSVRAPRSPFVSVARPLLAAAALAAALPLTGCSGSGPSTRVVDRPLMAQTAVDAVVPSADLGGLGFFDALESRPLATQDDALHGALLLGTGSSADTFPQRVAMGAELGYIPRSFDRPAREAVTIGELASMLAPIFLRQPASSPSDALSTLQSRGVTIGTGQPNQGLTGAQLVSVLGTTQDALTSAGVQKVPPPAIPAPIPETPASGSAPSPAQLASIDAVEDRLPQPLPSANASLEVAGRSEPLPVVPAGSNPPAIDVQDPRTTKPAVIGPNGAPTPSAQPRPRPGVKLAPMPPAPGPVGETRPATPNPAAPAPSPGPSATNPAPTTKPPATSAQAWTTGRPLPRKSKPVDPSASPASTTATADEPK